MIDVLMPRLGESVVEGTVTKWLVHEGQLVAREQPLLEVATDKADTEIPAPAAGRVTQIVAPEGAIVPAQGLLCKLDETAGAGAPEDERKAAPPPAAPSGPRAAAPAAPSGPRAAPPRAPSPAPRGLPPPAAEAPSEPAGRPPAASPGTRRLALQTGVRIKSIAGTGEHGRITREDVMRAQDAAAEPQRADAGGSEPPEPPQAGAPAMPAAQGSSAATELGQMIQAAGGFVIPLPNVGYGAYRVPPYMPKPGDEVVPFSRRRRITADHMVYSKVTSPHVVTVAEVDLHAVTLLRDEHKEQFKKAGVPLTFLAFVCAAVVKALREFPAMNSRVLDGSYAVLREVNLGIAVDTPGGLLVANVKQADQLSLRGLATSIDDLASRARTGKITADELAGATFTVSNPGQKGNLFGGAILSQPNVGIVRMGEIKKRVVVVTRGGEDMMAIHPVMFLALSYDHRVIDGVLGNSFLHRISEILTRGEIEL